MRLKGTLFWGPKMVSLNWFCAILDFAMIRKALVHSTLLLVLCVGSQKVSAQVVETKIRAKSDVTWTIQVDPLTTALGIVHVLFERRLSPRFTVYIGPSLRLYDSPLTDDNEEGYRAYGAEYGLRYFLQSSAPFGWWGGLRVVTARLSFNDEARLGGYVSGLFGYAWNVTDCLVLSGALGVSYFDYSVGGVGVSGVLPGAHTAIGLVF